MDDRNGRLPTNLQAILKLLLLFVDDAEPEVYLIGLLEVWLHAHDLGKGFFSVLQGAIAIVQYAYPIPQFGFLQNVNRER